MFVSIDFRVIFNYLKYTIRNQTVLFGSIRLLKWFAGGLDLAFFS
jgi:hypothetical protein